MGEEKNRHIGRCDQVVSFCTGCEACQMVCGLFHEGYTSLLARRIRVERDDMTCCHTILTCQNCNPSPCYEACPLKDEAMCYDEEKQVAYVDPDACIGCGLCIEACPYEIPRIQINNDGKAAKCDLCRNREEGPACIEFCQSMVLGFVGDQVPEAPEGVIYDD